MRPSLLLLALPCLGAARVAVGPEWVSNVDLAPDDEVPATMLRVAPSVAAALRQDAIEADLDLGYDLAWYPLLADRSRFDNVALDAGARFLPRSKVGFDIVEAAGVADRARDATSADEALTTRRSSETDAFVAFHPNARLTIRGGAGLSVDQYRDPYLAGIPEAQGFPGGFLSLTPELDIDPRTRTAWGPALDADWKVRRNTTLRLDGRTETFDWDQNLLLIAQETAGIDSPNIVYGSYLAIPGGWTWRLTAGPDHRFNRHVSVRTALGYGEMRFDPETVTDDWALDVDPGTSKTPGSPTSSPFNATASGTKAILREAGAPRCPPNGTAMPSRAS